IPRSITLRAGSPTLGKDAGRSRLRSTRPCRLRFFRPRSTNVLARVARRRSPTSYSPPCAMNSAVMSRSPQADRIGLGSIGGKHECCCKPRTGFASSYGQRAIGSTLDQLHSHAVDGRSPTGEVWASRHADGAGAADLYALEPGDALRSARSHLAEPRSIRAF